MTGGTGSGILSFFRFFRPPLRFFLLLPWRSFLRFFLFSFDVASFELTRPEKAILSFIIMMVKERKKY